jgi:hypothetical protein
MRWIGGMALPFAAALIGIVVVLVAVNVLVTLFGA